MPGERLLLGLDAQLPRVTALQIRDRERPLLERRRLGLAQPLGGFFGGALLSFGARFGLFGRLAHAHGSRQGRHGFVDAFFPKLEQLFQGILRLRHAVLGV